MTSMGLEELTEAERDVLCSVARTDFLAIITDLAVRGLVERNDDGPAAAFRLTPLGQELRAAALKARAHNSPGQPSC